MISKNLKVLRDLQNLTQDQLADKLEISRARIGSYEENRNIPPVEVLLKYSEFFHVALDAIVKADLTKIKDPTDLMKVGTNRILFPIVVDEQGNDTIEIVPVKTSAGYLNGYSDAEYIEALKRMKLPFLPKGKNRAFPIKGDSMPPLKDGSFVIGKYLSSPGEVKDGNTYVFLTRSEGIVYKRVLLNPKKKDIITLISDNKIYEPYEVKNEDIFEIWEYVCSLNIGSYKPEELNIASIMGMLRDLKVEIKSLGQSK